MLGPDSAYERITAVGSACRSGMDLLAKCSAACIWTKVSVTMELEDIPAMI